MYNKYYFHDNILNGSKHSFIAANANCREFVLFYSSQCIALDLRCKFNLRNLKFSS